MAYPASRSSLPSGIAMSRSNVPRARSRWVVTAVMMNMMMNGKTPMNSQANRFSAAGRPARTSAGSSAPRAPRSASRRFADRAAAGSGYGGPRTASPGYPRMTDFAQAGDFEGILTYGIGATRPVPHSNPQFPVRAYEVET